jgi:ubiquinone/menaquinone biosynthesis C-methylase UbiE
MRKNFDTKEDFRDFYEDTASTYDKDRSLDFEGRRVDALQRKFLNRHLGLKKGDKVIECGCGTGRMLLPLAAKGLKCYGMDTSKNMLNILKKKAKRNNLNVTTKQCDIEKIKFPDNTFDGVFSIHVLMHMQKIDGAIKEMVRIAKPGSKIVFDLPNHDSLWTKLSLALNPKMKRTSLYRISTIRKKLKGFNYKLDGLFSYARTFYQIPVIRHVAAFLDTFLPLPLKCRTQVMVVITKD